MSAARLPARLAAGAPARTPAVSQTTPATATSMVPYTICRRASDNYVPDDEDQVYCPVWRVSATEVTNSPSLPSREFTTRDIFVSERRVFGVVLPLRRVHRPTYPRAGRNGTGCRRGPSGRQRTTSGRRDFFHLYIYTKILSAKTTTSRRSTA